jgi:hypothetical protein
LVSGTPTLAIPFSGKTLLSLQHVGTVLVKDQHTICVIRLTVPGQNFYDTKKSRTLKTSPLSVERSGLLQGKTNLSRNLTSRRRFLPAVRRHTQCVRRKLAVSGAEEQHDSSLLRPPSFLVPLKDGGWKAVSSQAPLVMGR